MFPLQPFIKLNLKKSDHFQLRAKENKKTDGVSKWKLKISYKKVFNVKFNF